MADDENKILEAEVRAISVLLQEGNRLVRVSDKKKENIIEEDSPKGDILMLAKIAIAEEVTPALNIIHEDITKLSDTFNKNFLITHKSNEKMVLLLEKISNSIEKDRPEIANRLSNIERKLNNDG